MPEGKGSPKVEMMFTIRVLLALANVLLVTEGRSVKKCCEKLDPDAFRNIVSIPVHLMPIICLRDAIYNCAEALT